MNEFHKWYVTTAVINSVPGVQLHHERCPYDSPDICLWSVADINKTIINHMREWHSAGA